VGCCRHRGGGATLKLPRAAALAAALCLVLASRVFVTFDALRIKLVQSPIAATDGQVLIDPSGAELGDLTAPFAVIARVRHDAASRERFAIAVDGRVVCEPSLRAGASRRMDCALRGGWQASTTHHVSVAGPLSAWSLEYLELATHHGATRGHDLVIVPETSTRPVQLSRRWIALTFLGLAGLLLIEPAAMGPSLALAYRAAVGAATVFLALLLISPAVSPYTVLVSPAAYFQVVALLLAPRLWTAGQWLVPRPGQTPAAHVRSSAWRVVVVSGALGFAVGAVAFPDWQVAVETAQVVAGLVTYPAGNPFYVYHTKLWTVLHQLAAVPLLIGVSERALSVVISGLLGAVSFQAVSVLVYALSRDFLLAVGSGFIVFFTGVAEYGVIYPISLVGTTHTYGALGLSLIVLVAALFAVGYLRTAAFLLGIAPAVHPSLGVWFAGVVTIAALWDKHGRQAYRSLVPHFLAGCGLTILSFGLQIWLIQDVPSIPRGVADTYLAAFVRHWDGHRAPVDFGSVGMAMNIGALGLAALWLYKFGSHLSRAAGFVLRIIAVSGAASLVFALVSRAPVEQVPSALLILMPGRFLNFNAFVFPVLLFGLIGRYRATAWSHLLTLVAIVALLFTERSRLWALLGRETVLRYIAPERPVNTLAVLMLISMALLLCMRMAAPDGGRDRAASLPRIGVLVLACWIAIETWRLPAGPFAVFRDHTNDALFAAAAAGSGLLLTGGDLHLVQLRTRRGVLVDGGGLDGLPYSLEAAPELQRILRDVYAIDLFSPPEEARGSGTIPNPVNKKTWESYSLVKWREIRDTYAVTRVLTYADWHIALPAIARDERLVLYEIPP
jgi:hypothetical protein